MRLRKIIKIRRESFGHYYIKDAGPHIQFSYQPVILTTHFEAHLALPSPLMNLHHSNSQCSLKAIYASSSKGLEFLLDNSLCYSGTYFSFLFFSFFLFFLFYFILFYFIECLPSLNVKSSVLCSDFSFVIGINRPCIQFNPSVFLAS